MYLLDVLDGILPAVTEPKDAGQQDQYQEERRLFYVAVTRPEPAVSVRLPESGVRLCRRAAPGAAPGIHPAGGRVRLPEYGAVRKALSTRRKGRRRDPACCRGQCMVAYASGETEFLTLSQMGPAPWPEAP